MPCIVKYWSHQSAHQWRLCYHDLVEYWTSTSSCATIPAPHAFVLDGFCPVSKVKCAGYSHVTMRVISVLEHSQSAILLPARILMPLSSVRNSRRYCLSLSYRKVVRNSARGISWRGFHRRADRRRVAWIRAAARGDSLAEAPTDASSSKQGWRQKSPEPADSTHSTGLHLHSSMLSEIYGVEFEVEYPEQSEQRCANGVATLKS
jgi:hypothetical protein